jgi:hypothetical protein
MDKFDSIASKGMRKLAALGLSAVLKLNLSCVPPRFGEILTHVAAVWAEVEQGPDADRMALSYPIAGAGPRDDLIPVSVDLDEAEGEAARRQALFVDSPVAALLVKEHFQQCMALAPRGEALRHAAAGLDAPSRIMLEDLLG